MSASRALPLLALLGCIECAADEPLCPELESPFPDDLRIRESELTAERAQQALDALREAPTLAGFELFVASANHRKALVGYALERQARLTGSAEDAERFCRWLASEGVWYD